MPHIDLTDARTPGPVALLAHSARPSRSGGSAVATKPRPARSAVPAARIAVGALQSAAALGAHLVSSCD